MRKALFAIGLILGFAFCLFLIKSASHSQERAASVRLQAFLSPAGIEVDRSPRPKVDFLGWWVYSLSDLSWWKVKAVSDQIAGTVLWPGYVPFWRTDSAIVEKLQTLEFDFSLRIDEKVDGYYFLASSEGCFPILEKYGADTLLMGNCEGYRDVLPAQLYRSRPKHRVLPCFRNESDLFFAERIVRALQDLPLAKRPRNVIWSFSLWQLFQKFNAQSAETVHRRSQGDIFAWVPRLRVWGQFLNGFVEKQNIHSGEVLARQLRSDSDGVRCDPIGAAEQFRKVRSLLVLLAGAGIRVTLALSPVVASVLDAQPACYAIWRAKMIDFEKEGIAVVVPDSPRPDLEWSDFLVSLRGAAGEKSVLTIHHLNAAGAEKQTKRINSRIVD